MGEVGLYVRVQRGSEWKNLDITELNEEEVKTWVREKQKQNPDYDIQTIIALAKVFREQVHPIEG